VVLFHLVEILKACSKHNVGPHPVAFRELLLQKLIRCVDTVTWIVVVMRKVQKFVESGLVIERHMRALALEPLEQRCRRLVVGADVSRNMTRHVDIDDVDAGDADEDDELKFEK
jgi:hypothetical protein